MRHVSSRSAYVYGIDAVRFLAAVFVALFHLTWLHAGTAGIAWCGWIGVQIFFVISGFVIAGSANDTTPARFVRSRFLRLYPAAWLCALLSLVVVAFWTRGIGHLGVGLALRFGASLMLYPSGPFIASAYWTLPIEISFYLLILAVLMARQFHRLERVATILCVASAVYLAAYGCERAGLFSTDILEFGYGWKNISLLRHGIYFATGLYLWLWSQGLLSRTGIAGGCLCLAVAPIEISCRAVELLVQMPLPLRTEYACLTPFIIWLAGCAVLAASTIWASSVARLPSGLLRLVRVAGLTTYPLYLIHEDVGGFARDILIRLGFGYLASACAALLLVAAIATIIARAGEPALRRMLQAGLNRIGNRSIIGQRLPFLSQSGGVL